LFVPNVANVYTRLFHMELFRLKLGTQSTGVVKKKKTHPRFSPKRAKSRLLRSVVENIITFYHLIIPAINCSVEMLKERLLDRKPPPIDSADVDHMLL
jgi:hypothetical protein